MTQITFLVSFGYCLRMISSQSHWFVGIDTKKAIFWIDLSKIEVFLVALHLFHCLLLLLLLDLLSAWVNKLMGRHVIVRLANLRSLLLRSIRNPLLFRITIFQCFYDDGWFIGNDLNETSAFQMNLRQLMGIDRETH